MGRGELDGIVLDFQFEVLIEPDHGALSDSCGRKNFDFATGRAKSWRAQRGSSERIFVLSP
jgi:hypothetical protein